MDTGRKEVPVFQGQITIFLSLILVLLVSVLCGILETARSHVLKLQMEIAMDSAMESVTAEYSTELFRRFGLLYCYDDGNLPAGYKIIWIGMGNAAAGPLLRWTAYRLHTEDALLMTAARSLYSLRRITCAMGLWRNFWKKQIFISALPNRASGFHNS